MARPSATTLESECTAEERALLMETLKNSAFSGAHLEIGTAAGGTLKEMMGQYAPDARPDFFVIDPLTYYPDQEYIITRNLISAGIDPNLVTFWKGVTQDFIDPARASGQMFDFVFIDGDHRHYYVTVDLQWADCVTKGGVIALHDHGAAFPGVGWAIDTFLAHNPDFKIEARAGSLTILRRIAVTKRPTVTAADLRHARRVHLMFRWKRSLKKRLGLR
jgi:hypothetical protein